MASILVQYDPLAGSYAKKDGYGPELIKLKKLDHDAFMKMHTERIGVRAK
jgi:hypothetical protein